MNQVAHIGVLFYFAAGLLPDPDGPWSPTIPHCHAWIAAALFETIIAAVFLSQQSPIDVPNAVLDSLAGLAFARVAIFALMAGLLVRRQLKLRAPKAVSSSEHEPLLGNGEEPARAYGGANGSAMKKGGKKPRDAQNSGWFDYFAGFKVLFPYLWYVCI